MMRVPKACIRVGIASAVLAGFGFASLGVNAGGWNSNETYSLPDISLTDFLADHLPGLGPVNDHGVDLGGIGSDLWHGPGDGPGIYWMLTDRGPNGEDPRTFPVPEFTPFILQVKTTKDGAIEILEAIPITGPGVAVNGVTGIPNLDNVTAPPALNEPFFGCGGSPQLDTNPNGIDPEGLVRTLSGDFWVVEEYSPSLLKIDANGRVVKRFYPAGVLDYLDEPAYEAVDSTIPAIFGLKRKLNRGFEGLALSPDGKTLYLGLQSPLVNPDTATGNESRITRILAFDIPSETVVAEYAYRFQWTGSGTGDDEFDVPVTGGRARARDMKVSALAMLDAHRMLVLERTDFKAKVYCVDLREATNILGTEWDDVGTAPSLETFNADGALEDEGVTPLPKQFVIELSTTAGYPLKIEGLTVIDGKTIAIANDNDFGVGTFTGADCTLVDTGFESKIIVIRLDAPPGK
jgi:hypothetical protein